MIRQRSIGDDSQTYPGRDIPGRGESLSSTARARWGAAIVAIAPAVLCAAFVYHPHLHGVLPNNEAVAEAVIADPTRWAMAHLGIGVGSGLLILAFLALRSYLREAGENRWSAVALPFIVIGSTLYALLPAMEFAPLAAAEIGADAAAAQGAVALYFLPILLTGAILFFAGSVGFAVAISRSGVLSGWSTVFVGGMLVIMAASRFVPLSVVQMYVQGVAGVIALWPMAVVMWKHETARPVVQPETARAS